MKKKRKVFIISWFYWIGAIIVTLMPIGLIVFCSYYLTVFKKDINICIGLIIFSSIMTVFSLFICGRMFWQWVIIDGNKITARNIFGIIREITWSDVKEVQGVPIRYNVSDPIMQWFLFVDNKNGKIFVKSPFNLKGQCIRIKASKRNREFLLQCKPDLQFTQFLGDD